MSEDLTCLECWASLRRDPFHFDCSGEHYVPTHEANRIREWLRGRYAFMVSTGQRKLRADSGAVV